MVVKKVKEYLGTRSQATLEEIYLSIEEDKGVVEHTLHLLQQNGSVIKEELEQACSGCGCAGSCSEEAIIYRLQK